MKKLNLYWMSNPEWYDFADNEDAEPYLTESAPPEAVESFKRFLEQKEEMNSRNNSTKSNSETDEV